MTERQRIIPIQPGRESPLRPVLSLPKGWHAPGAIQDTRGRWLRDLRVSVIDQCNLRCRYCMPREVFNDDYVYLSRQQMLSFDEITRVARSFTQLGVQKIRLTGGEPLLRKQLDLLIIQLAALRTLEDQPVELALTTNGLLLAQKARLLADAGLHRVTVSLDAIDPMRFQQMADDPGANPQQVLEGIAEAKSMGLKLKANMVVQKGVNEEEILPMAAAFRDLGVSLRFIEFMDVGSSNGWSLEHVVPSELILQRIGEHWPLERVGREIASEVSERWRYADGRGEIGFISSVTAPFCGDCSRARLSAEGGLYTCLFAHQGLDLKPLVRSQITDEELRGVLADCWTGRTDRYSEIRAELQASGQQRPKVEMSYIGG